MGGVRSSARREKECLSVMRENESAARNGLLNSRPDSVTGPQPGAATGAPGRGGTHGVLLIIGTGAVRGVMTSLITHRPCQMRSAYSYTNTAADTPARRVCRHSRARASAIAAAAIALATTGIAQACSGDML
eukprot:scaffold18042_cov65-Phaeocystis_antarctica.AAC.4